ncbi:hypothetical protein [Heliophilum fasciatum]|uniref:VCBS repeat-containing protein n=1 Tax=Heliophilum fasciatum TaxID=35700 RepID=A0A4R2SBY6_9FIRM|nr:hypothetical protein [Heliophilum fasciatum]MCW2276854.1 hypothetical protein [Heliophilum fasciatum]TCP68685.1 hypothetical protein EDD73_10281 [Heliophilum fasciatum]
MRIMNSNITMASAHSASESYARTETLRIQKGNTLTTLTTDERGGVRLDEKRAMNDGRAALAFDALELSDDFKAQIQQQAQQTQQAGAVEPEDDVLFALSDKDRQKIEMLQQFIKAMTGKEIKFILPERIKKEQGGRSLQLQLQGTAAGSSQARVGWGRAYDRHIEYREEEKMAFNAQGTFQTADGKSVNFAIQMTMSRAFAASEHISIRAGDAIDPLVINFDGKAAELTERNVSFDIDLNGSADRIAFVKPGSGFLALDRNNDGTINDGSELFGPNSGNGFAELAAFDSDNNNWIDENDPIFEKLRIWSKDEAGNDYLFALGQKGVGAIYLGSVATGFTIKNSSNEALGQVQQSGIFVKENGQVGTVQQIDLVI